MSGCGEFMTAVMLPFKYQLRSVSTYDWVVSYDILRNFSVIGRTEVTQKLILFLLHLIRKSPQS